MRSDPTIAPAPSPLEVRRLPAPRAYALWARSYDSGPNPILALQERVLGPLLAARPSRCVVDIGCGTGRWLEKLLGSGLKCGLGIDFSRAMLARAARKPLLRGRLIRAESTRLPLPSNLADLLICSFLVGHIADLQALAGELARIACPGAHVYVSDFHPASYSRGWRRTFRHAGRLFEVTSAAHAIDSVCRIFATQGFELQRCLEPCFGEPEKPIFEEHGKLAQFAELCGYPAIYLCHFLRTHHF